jgi:hypothetical protein
VWWYTPVIPALRKLRQEDHMFEAGLGYIIRIFQEKQSKTKYLVESITHLYTFLRASQACDFAHFNVCRRL